MPHVIYFCNECGWHFTSSDEARKCEEKHVMARHLGLLSTTCNHSGGPCVACKGSRSDGP